MIIIPASDIIQTNYRTYDGMPQTAYNGFDGDFSNIQLIGFNGNNSDDRGINLASATHAYPYNLIADTISEDDQREVPRSKNTTKGVYPTYESNIDYRDKSSSLIIVIVYDLNNEQFINLSGITSLDIAKAKQAAIPVYCYISNNELRCSSICQIRTENSETMAGFYYDDDLIIAIDENGVVTVESEEPEVVS